jgi:hypothetical protein
MEKIQQVERPSLQPKIPPLPPWPTSRPGPMITEPPAGQRRLLTRTDQVMEVRYDQVQGRSAMRREEK